MRINIVGSYLDKFNICSICDAKTNAVFLFFESEQGVTNIC